MLCLPVCLRVSSISSCVQVRELNTECIRLTTSYPGANATVISNSMEEVQLAWESLQVASSARKKKLRAALELQKLLSSVSVWCVHVNICIMHMKGTLK